MKLRAHLFQLTLGTVVPPIVLAIILGILLVRYEYSAVRQGALDRNRAFITAVDAELRGHMTTLEALRASRLLEAGNYPGFREQALRVLQSQHAWQNVVLSLPSGQQVVNTAYPDGSELPAVLDPPSLQRVLQTGAFTVGDVTLQSQTGKYGVPVRVPVWRNGVVAYVLSAMIDLETFTRLIEAQKLRPSWVSGIVDRSGYLVARVPPRSPGEKAAAIYRDAVAQSTEGWFRGRTIEGRETYTAFRSSNVSGWSVGLALPVEEVDAAAYRAAWLVGLGTLLTIALAATLAVLLGRRVIVPISELATAARSIGRDRNTAALVPATDVDELRDVAGALTEAAKAIEEREALMEREQANLRAADRAKDEFLAMLGHELRNPLSAVSNAVVLLSRADLSSQRRASLYAIITRQTEQLTRLVNDLLDVGRVVAGKIHLEQQPVNICKVTAIAISAIEASGRAEAHRLTVHAARPVVVQGDRARLEQVVTNLVINALTYTPANGTVDVTVATDEGHAMISVADSGIGLRDEDREAVFELFYQGDRPTHHTGGLGIGLTLVRRLVEMHGGSVTAASRGLGKGSTFTVRLPLVPALMPSPDEESPIAHKVPALTILVVDDSEDVRTSMRLRLEMEGHQVHLAHDGLSGLDAALRIRPDVALIDIAMPGIDGYELASRIRLQLQADILLVALTGYGQQNDVRRAVDRGFDAYMIKPADFALLDTLLARYAQRHV